MDNAGGASAPRSPIPLCRERASRPIWVGRAGKAPPRSLLLSEGTTTMATRSPRSILLPAGLVILGLAKRKPASALMLPWKRRRRLTAPSGSAGSRAREAAAAQEPLSRPAWPTAGWTPSTSAERHSMKVMAVGRRPCPERPANQGRYDVQRPAGTLPHRGTPCGSSQSLFYRCFSVSLC